MLKEVCVENFTDIGAAIDKGGNRIELCDNLAVGGTTVSYGVMEHTLSYCEKRSIPVMCIIRPRGGDFCYSKEEAEMMKTDILVAKKLGAYGVVIGALDKEGWIDEELMEELLQSAEGLAITFHMAFDEIPYEKQTKAIDWLASKGVDRILTHGGKGGTPIEGNVENLKRLMDYAGGRILVMPGGGITNENMESLEEILGFKEIHGTKILGKLS